MIENCDRPRVVKTVRCPRFPENGRDVTWICIINLRSRDVQHFEREERGFRSDDLMAVSRHRVAGLAPEWTQLAVVGERRVKSGEVFHLDFRATERERQSIKRLGARQCDSGAAQKFVKRRMRKLRCQFDRGKIAAASQRIARANRPKKFAIEIFRIVIAETARRVCQDRQWMNQHLIEYERVDEWFESGT